MAIPPEQDKGMSIEALELARYYDEHYEFAVRLDYAALTARSPVKLGDEIRPRSCRYCGKSDPTLFRNVAHAIPEFIGNRFVISVDECDECNSFFANEIDNHFANFLGLRRTLWRVRGKNGVPKYAIPGQSPRLWLEGGSGFRAEGKFEDEFLQIATDGQTGRIIGRRPPYRPRAVFKALAKSALALMPASDLHYYAGLIKWLRGGTAESAKYMAFTSWTEVKRKGFEALLLRRVGQKACVPYYSFVLSFSNMSMQIFLPHGAADSHLVGQALSVKRLPNAAERFGRVSYGIEDLSSDEICRDKSDEITFEILEPTQVTRLDGTPLTDSERDTAFARVAPPAEDKKS